MSRLNHVEFVRSLRWAKMRDVRMHSVSSSWSFVIQMEVEKVVAEKVVEEEEVEEEEDETKSRKRGREALRTASDAHEF